MGYCMGTLDRTDDTLGSCEVFKRFYCLIVRYRNVFGAADVMQICMLRSNDRVVKACGNRVNRCDLTEFLMAKVGFQTEEDNE